MNKEEFEEFLTQKGVKLNPDNNSSNLKVYNGYVYLFIRQLKEDFYFLNEGEPYLLKQNDDYLNTSVTETGKYPDSRKIKFDKCEKITNFNVPRAENEGSIISEEIKLDEQYFVRKVLGGSQIYYKLISGLCVSVITLGATDSKIEISQHGVQSVNVGTTELIPVNKSIYESALINALKIISNANTKG